MTKPLIGACTAALLVLSGSACRTTQSPVGPRPDPRFLVWVTAEGNGSYTAHLRPTSWRWAYDYPVSASVERTLDTVRLAVREEPVMLPGRTYVTYKGQLVIDTLPRADITAKLPVDSSGSYVLRVTAYDRRDVYALRVAGSDAELRLQRGTGVTALRRAWWRFW